MSKPRLKHEWNEPVQLQFSWEDEDPRAEFYARPRTDPSIEYRRAKGALLLQKYNVNWPPREGDTIYFETSLGVQKGVLAQVRQGLVWMDYFLQAGRIVREQHLVICSHPTPWRHPDTVSETEREAWADKIRGNLEAGVDIQQDEAAWADFCHFVMFTLLRIRVDRERELASQRAAEQTSRPM